MTYDRAAIMKAAWATARQHREWAERQDWTQKGPAYGCCRPTTPAERRVIFVEALRGAWAAARFRVAAQRRFLASQTPAGRALQDELDMMQNRERLTCDDFRQMDALRDQIDALAGIA